MLGSRWRPLAVVAQGSPYSCQTWMRLPSSERLVHSAVAGWVGVPLVVNAVPHSCLFPLLVPSALPLGWSGFFVGWYSCWSSGLPPAFDQTLMRLPSQERLARQAVVGVGLVVLLAGLFRRFLGPRWLRCLAPPFNPGLVRYKRRRSKDFSLRNLRRPVCRQKLPSLKGPGVHAGTAGGGDGLARRPCKKEGP